MANPQHIEWLLEGVEAWNARRARDGFVPDLEGADFRKEFERKVRLHDFENLPLTGYDLRNANMNRAILHGINFRSANLNGASLISSTLRDCDIIFANSIRADFTRSQLIRVSFLGTDLSDTEFELSHLRSINFRQTKMGFVKLNRVTIFSADVSTDIVHESRFSDARKIVNVDLRHVQSLNQSQLNAMLGDSGTILPDHLTRPDHWPDISDQITQANDDDATPGMRASDGDQGTHSKTKNENTAHLFSQISIILAAPIKHAAAAELLNDQLDSAVRMFRDANRTNEQPDDLILVEKFSDMLREIRTALGTPEETAQSELETHLPELLAIITDLRRTIDAQAQEIKDLKSQKPDRTDFQKMRSAFAISFGTALGAGTAATVISAGDALLGQYGASTVQQLRDAFGSFFGATPTTPPPTLPPTLPT